MWIDVVGCQSICAQSLTDEQEKEIKEERPRNYTVCVYFTSPNLDSPANSHLISKAVEDELEQAKKIDETTAIE
ncbi:MAG: hypothetical protein LIP03_05815 [Bacteroidales bacterium]|nr:hypothetical protein [Bacteroidales bacterium]